MTTRAEKAWMDAITQIGCIVCLLRENVPGAPGAVHHLLNGKKRKGHMFTICLCDPGHHQNSPIKTKVSRHPNKTFFEQAYGTEEQLLAESRRLVAERFGLTVVMHG